MREVFIFISIFYYFLSQYFLFLRSVSISGTYPRQSVAVLTKKYLHSTYLKDMKGLLDYVIYYTRQKHVVGYKRVQTVVLDALCQTFQEKTHHFFTHPLFLKLDKYVFVTRQIVFACNCRESSYLFSIVSSTTTSSRNWKDISGLIQIKSINSKNEK